MSLEKPKLVAGFGRETRGSAASSSREVRVSIPDMQGRELNGHDAEIGLVAHLVVGDRISEAHSRIREGH